MAGDTHEVDLGADLDLPPWPTVLEIARTIRTDDWALVGGLMVRLHEHRAGVTPVRITTDVDMLVDVAAPSVSLASTAAAITGLGFEPEVPDERRKPVYRFVRGAEQIDLMVPDHLPRGVVPRLRARPAFPVDGGAQALLRRDVFRIPTPEGTVAVAAPDVLGAFIGKAVAHQVDSRDPDRHLADGATLAASMVDGLPAGLAGPLSKNDRRRLRHLTSLLEPASEAWDQLEPADAARGQQRVALIAQLVEA